MNIVLDANIFISAYFWGGKPRMIIRRVASGFDTLFITNDIIKEVECAIQKPKFDAYQEQINAMIAGIEAYSQKIAVSRHHQVANICRDKDDEKYIECAIAADADFLISGDADLLELKECYGIRIVTANEYLNFVTDNDCP